jgi:hypothetical protein
MSPIAKALLRGYRRDAERLRTGILRHPLPAVDREFTMLMMGLAVKLACGVAPGQKGSQ